MLNVQAATSRHAYPARAYVGRRDNGEGVLFPILCLFDQEFVQTFF